MFNWLRKLCTNICEHKVDCNVGRTFDDTFDFNPRDGEVSHICWVCRCWITCPTCTQKTRNQLAGLTKKQRIKRKTEWLKTFSKMNKLRIFSELEKTQFITPKLVEGEARLITKEPAIGLKNVSIGSETNTTMGQRIVYLSEARDEVIKWIKLLRKKSNDSICLQCQKWLGRGNKYVWECKIHNSEYDKSFILTDSMYESCDPAMYANALVWFFGIKEDELK